MMPRVSQAQENFMGRVVNGFEDTVSPTIVTFSKYMPCDIYLYLTPCYPLRLAQDRPQFLSLICGHCLIWLQTAFLCVTSYPSDPPWVRPPCFGFSSPNTLRGLLKTRSASYFLKSSASPPSTSGLSHSLVRNHPLPPTAFL